MPKVDKDYERAVTGDQVIPHKQGVAVFNGPFGRQPGKATLSVAGQGQALHRQDLPASMQGKLSFPSREVNITVKDRTGLGLLMTAFLVPRITVRPKDAGDSDQSSRRTYCGKHGNQNTGFGATAIFQENPSAAR